MTEICLLHDWKEWTGSLLHVLIITFGIEKSTLSCFRVQTIIVLGALVSTGEWRLAYSFNGLQYSSFIMFLDKIMSSV